MKRLYTDRKEGKTYQVETKKLISINTAFESAIEMADSLEPEQIGNVFIAVVNYIYRDKPIQLETKIERAKAEKCIEEAVRLGFTTLKRTSNLKNVESGVKEVADTNTCEIYMQTEVNEEKQEYLTIKDIENQEEIGNCYELSDLIAKRDANNNSNLNSDKYGKFYEMLETKLNDVFKNRTFADYHLNTDVDISSVVREIGMTSDECANEYINYRRVFWKNNKLPEEQF